MAKSCTIKIEDSKIYQELKNVYGTNESKIFSLYVSVISNGEFTPEFQEWHKKKARVKNIVTVNTANPKTIIKYIEDYYNRHNPDGNTSVIKSKDNLIGEYGSIDDRIFCQRTTANEMLDIFRDWHYVKFNERKLSRDEYINKARINLLNRLKARIFDKLNMTNDDFEENISKNRIVDLATEYIKLGETKNEAIALAKIAHQIRLVEILAENNLSDQDKNLIATLKESIDSHLNKDGVKISENFFNEVFNDSRLDKIRKEVDDEFDTEEEDREQTAEDIALGAITSEDIDSHKDTYDISFRVFNSHDGQYSTFMTHVSSNIAMYFNSLRKLNSTGTVNGKYNYDINNPIGIADTMSANACAAMMYSQGEYGNVDIMIKSIKRIAEQVPGFESFIVFANDLKNDMDFAYEVYRTFGKMIISKQETYIENGERKTRISNNSASKREALKFEYMNALRSSSINVDYNTALAEQRKITGTIKKINDDLRNKLKWNNKTQKLEAYDKNTDEYKIDLSNLKADIAKAIKMYISTIDETVINNFISSNKIKGIVDEIANISLLNTALNTIIQGANATYNSYSTKVIESAEARRHNRQLDELVDANVPVSEDDRKDSFAVWNTDYLSKKSQEGAIQLSDLLVPYTTSKIELNSRNVAGNLSSDVINSSMITNLMNILQSDLNTEENLNSPINNYAAYKFRSKQYNFSNILVEQEENGKIVNYGIFKLVNGKYVPTSYAKILIRMTLFNGISDYGSNKSALYSQMSQGDYIATAMINYHNSSRVVPDIDVADYMMRTPSDAPKNFIFSAPKYKFNFKRGNETISFYNIKDEQTLNNRVRELINNIPHKATELKLKAQLLNDNFSTTARDLLVGGTVKSLTIVNKAALKTIPNSLEAYLKLSIDGVDFIVKGTLSDNNTKLTNVKLEHVDTNNAYVTWGSNIYKELETYFRNNLIKGNLKLADGSTVKRTINKEHPIYKQMYYQFKQEMLNAATAIDKMFVHTNGFILLDEQGNPVFNGDFQQIENKDRAVYANYHNKTNTYYDKNGVKHEEKGIVQNYWRPVYDENGKLLYHEKTTLKKLSGNVFTSDRFTVFDENNEVVRNFLQEVISEEIGEREDGKIHILYGGANTHLHIDSDGNIEFTEAQEKLINAKLEEFIQAYVNSTSERVSKFENLLEGIPHNEDDIAEFILNYRLAYFGCCDLFDGDSKFYKSPQDFLKREKEVQGSGVPYAVTDFTKPMFGLVHAEAKGAYLNSAEMQEWLAKVDPNNTLHNLKQFNTFRGATVINVVRTSEESQGILVKQLTDNFVKANIKPEEARKLAEEMMDGYKNTKVNDAQSYITFEEWIRRIAARGQLHKYKPLIAAILDESKPLSVEDIQEFVQVQKNFYYDMTYNELTGVMAPRQIKNAEFVLVPRLIRGTELEKVYDVMIENEIDQLNTEETSKAGKANVLTLWDRNGNLTSEWIKDFNTNIKYAIETYDYNYLYTQQETPQHVNAENKAGIQIMKKIIDNIPNDITVNGKKIKGVKQRFLDNYAQNIYDSFDELMKELNVERDEQGNILVDEYGNIKGLDYKLFLDRVKDEMIRLGLDSNMLDMVTVINTTEDKVGDNGLGLRTKVSPYFNSTRKKFESVSQAVFNNYITRQKLPGFHAAQVTNIGWKPFRNKVSNVSYSKELKWHPDGERYIEVMLPPSAFGLDRNDSKYDNIREQAVKESWTNEELEAAIDNAMLAELRAKKLDTFVGYRIPTEGKQSVCVMKLKGFTPSAYGSTIIVPDDWVAQTGSDFDIDSVYGIMWSTYFDDNGIQKIEYSEDTNKNYINHILRQISKEDRNSIYEKAKLNKDIRKETLAGSENDSYITSIQKLEQKKQERLLFYVKEYADEHNLTSYEEFSTYSYSAQNTRKARNNQILQDIIDILQSDEAFEESVSQSQFTHIIKGRDKATSDVDKLRRDNRSPFDFLDQAEYQEDAMSGAKLKARSVVLDTMCSVSNATKPVLVKGVSIIYKGDFETLQKRFDRKKDGKYEGLVKDLGNGKVLVTHKMYGHSNDNRNAIGKLLTVYSSETTAHILDAIKEGAIKNVNDLTFGVYKLFPNIGSDYDTAVSFMVQPGVTEIVDAYNRNKSIYSKKYNDPINAALRNVAKKLQIPNYSTISIAKLDAKVRELIKANGKFNNVLDSELLIARVKGNTDIFSTPVEESLFDYAVIKKYQELSNIADKIDNYTRVLNPDKFGAKQTIFATNEVFDNIESILTDTEDVFEQQNGKPFLANIYPDIDKIVLEGIEAYITSKNNNSTYPPLHHFLKYSTASSIKINRTLFLTQRKEFIDCIKQIKSVMSGLNPTLTEETYNDFEKYVLADIYKDIDIISRQVSYEKGKGIVETNGNKDLERARIFGYGYNPDLKVKTITNVPRAIKQKNTTEVTPKATTTFSTSSDNFRIYEENANWSDITIALAENLMHSYYEQDIKNAAGNKYVSHSLSATNNVEDIADSIYKQILDKGKTTDLKLNIVGDNIYSLPKSQRHYNTLLTNVIKTLQDKGVIISVIRSGGDTGIEEAGIIAAQRLSIPSIVYTTPKYAFREKNGKLISDEAAFKARFNQQDTTSIPLNFYEGDITPDENTIFVFGSNPEGRHGAGAAKVAKEQFGAKSGVGEGLTGNSYALPTKDLRVDKRPIPSNSTVVTEAFGETGDILKIKNDNGAKIEEYRYKYYTLREPRTKFEKSQAVNVYGQPILKDGKIFAINVPHHEEFGEKWYHDWVYIDTYNVPQEVQNYFLSDGRLRSIPKESIVESIKKLYETARTMPDKQFKVAYRNTNTTSLNGYTGLEMIDMFKEAGPIPNNIVFSEEWIDTGKILNSDYQQNNVESEVASAINDITSEETVYDQIETFEEFKPVDINKPTQEEIDKFCKLTPAQKVKWVQEHFRNGLICNYLNVNLANSGQYRKNKAGSQTIEFIEETQDRETMYDMFRKTYQNRNPFLVLTAMDLIKYAFIVEGYNMRKGAINKIIDNDILTNPLGLMGTGIMRSLDSKVQNFAKNVSQYRIDRLAEDFVRGHSNMTEISHTYISKKEKSKYFKSNAYGLLALSTTNEQFLLDNDFCNKNSYGSLVFNKYIKIKEPKNKETLYLIKPGLNGTVYLVPLNLLQETESSVWSSNDANNKYNPKDYYMSLIEEYENTYEQYDIVSLHKLAVKKYKENKEKYAKPKANKVKKDKETIDFDINDDSIPGAISLKQQITNHFNGFNGSPLYTESNFLRNYIKSTGLEHGLIQVVNDVPYLIYKLNTNHLYDYTNEKGLTKEIRTKDKVFEHLINAARQRGYAAGHPGEAHLNNVYCIRPAIISKVDEDTRSSSVVESMEKIIDRANKDIRKKAIYEENEAAEKYVKQTGNGAQNSSTANLENVVISASEYVSRTVDKILNGEHGLNLFIKDPDTGSYISITDPKVIDMIRQDPKLRRNYLKTLLEAQHLINTFESFATFKYDADNANIKHYVEKINEAIKKLSESSILKEAENLYVTGYLAKISNNPNIKNNIISLLDGYHDTSWLAMNFNDLQATNNPIIQIITSDVMADIRAKEFRGAEMVREFKKNIARIKAEAASNGQTINWKNIIDEYGRFVQDYNESFINDLEAHRTAVDDAYEAYKNSSDMYEQLDLFEKYLQKKLAYDKWKLANINQEVSDDYYYRRIKLEESMINSDTGKFASVYVQYCILNDKLRNAISHERNGSLDAFWEDERKRILDQIRDLRSTTIKLPNGEWSIKRDYEPYAFSSDPKISSIMAMSTLSSAIRLDNFINSRNELIDEYYEKTERFGFRDVLERNLDIVKRRERVDPISGRPFYTESENAENEEYVRAKAWVKQNAIYLYDIYKKDDKELSKEEKSKLLKDYYDGNFDIDNDTEFENRVKAALDYFKNAAGARNNNKSVYKRLAKKHDARDINGVVDARLFTPEEIRAIKKEQEARYGIGESVQFNERSIIKNATTDDTIYTDAFYKGMQIDGITNVEYLKIVANINEILHNVLNPSTGELNTSKLTIEQLESLLVEFGKLGYDSYEQTFSSKNSVKKHLGVTKRNVKKVRDFIDKNVDFVLSEEDQFRFNREKDKANEIGGTFYLRWQEVNQEWDESKGMFVPNHLLWGHAKPKDSLSQEEKDKFISKEKTAAVRILNKVFTETPTIYYELEYDAKAREFGEDSKEFKDWYNDNHIYNPHKHRYEPITCWTNSEPNETMPGTWEPTYKMTDRHPKTDKQNTNYRHNLGEAANYKNNPNSNYAKKNNLNEGERKLKEYIQNVLGGLATTKAAKRYFDKGYLPSRAIKGNTDSKFWLKELAKGLGYVESNAGFERWDETVDYDHDYVPEMPMLHQLQSKDSIREPYREMYDTDEEYDEAKKEYDEHKEENKKHNAEIHKSLLDNNWESVIEEFITKAAHYNAIQDNKYQLYFGQKLIDDILVYQTRSSSIHNLRRERKYEQGQEDEYQKKVDKNLQEQYTNWIRRVIFDQYKRAEGNKTRFLQILQGVTSVNYMTLNIRGGIANVLVGEANIFNEWFAKEQIGAKEWYLGKKHWMSAMGSFAANMYKETSTSVADAIIKGFNIVDYDENTGRVTQKSLAEWSERVRDAAFSPQTITEHFMQNSVMLGLMESHRLVPNPRYGEPGEAKWVAMNENEFAVGSMEDALKEICSEEEYNRFKSFVEQIKRNPNEAKEYAWFRKNAISEFVMTRLSSDKQNAYVKAEQRIRKEKKSEFLKYPTLYSQFKLGEDGKMAFVADSILAKMNVVQEGQEVSDAYKLLGKFKGRVVSVNKNIHGNYGKLDSAKIESECWGSLLMQYHKHIPVGIAKRYRRKGYFNEERGTVDKGSYAALFDLLKTPIDVISKRNKLSSGQTEALRGIQNIFSYTVDYLHYIKLAWNTAPEYERANYRRALGDIAGTVVALAMAMLICLGYDDDDESIIYNLTLYEADRLATETFMWNPVGAYSEAKKLWSSPIAAQSIIGDCLNIMGTISGIILLGEEYDPYFRSGRYAGEYKLWVYTERRIPYWRNYVAIRDIADNNHYYKIGDNALSVIPVRDIANTIRDNR